MKNKIFREMGGGKKNPQQFCFNKVRQKKQS